MALVVTNLSLFVCEYSMKSTVTQGVKGVQEEITHKDAELTGLRASVRCSAKLLQVKNCLRCCQLLKVTTNYNLVIAENGEGLHRDPPRARGDTDQAHGVQAVGSCVLIVLLLGRQPERIDYGD